MKANDIYDAAIMIDCQNSVLHHNKGNVLMQLNRYMDAEIEMTKAIDLEPSAINYNGRAV